LLEKQKRGPRVGRLNTIGNVASELGRIYRKCREGTINPADGVRFSQMLLGIRLCLENSLIEQKIQSLEDAVAAVGSSHAMNGLRPSLPRLPRVVDITSDKH
jgi:hypothetical protein